MDSRLTIAAASRTRPASGSLSVALFLLTIIRVDAQQTAQNPAGSPPAAASSSQPETKKPAAPETQAAPADPRQAQIVADTQKLLKLTQELKDEVAKSNKDTLSLSVIKKADEVEKLAKTLKEELSRGH